MARTLIHVPPNAKAGEVVEIRTTIAHTMETGFRADSEGKTLPRDIITRFTCRYGNDEVFSADLYPAIAANPYVAFTVRAGVTAPLVFTWEGDNGFSATETVTLNVS
jgi:sulfur-oxidizing protein SoxZ